LLFHGQTSVEDGIYQIKQQVPPGEEIDEIIEFLGDTKNGLMTKL
jgi:acyl-[acyl-carrier-protein]--UDP-N-acetylglucosamine O-acyltransferase (UDP-N-acetylglucosamine acyltransferase)